MLLPNVLVIGAMKAGTTSLWADLARSHAVFVPANKEPGDLAREAILAPGGLDRYARHYEGARPDQLRFDFSTDLAKFPDLPGSGERARRLLGGDVRIIYLTRDPVGRLLSHHRHMARIGKMSPDLSTAVRNEPGLVDYGCYAMQLEQWSEHFGRDQVHLSSLEEYRSDRDGFFARLETFLDLDLGAVAQSSASRRNVGAIGPRSRLVRSVVEANTYRSRISPLVPDRVKNVARAALERRSPTVESDWSSLDGSLQASINDRFRDDATKMADRWGHAVSNRLAPS